MSEPHTDMGGGFVRTGGIPKGGMPGGGMPGGIPIGTGSVRDTFLQVLLSPPACGAMNGPGDHWRGYVGGDMLALPVAPGGGPPIPKGGMPGGIMPGGIPW
jgi:hypothetical protein